MDNNSGAVVYVVALVVIPILIAFALWIFVALGRVFSKFGEPHWKAWVPFLNIVTLLNLAGLNVAFIAVYLIPGVNSFSPIVTTLAAHQINLRFGKGNAHTVLAFLLFPVWATVLGFGSAVPIGGRPAAHNAYGIAPGAGIPAAPASWEPRAHSSFAPPPALTAPIATVPGVIAEVPIEISRVPEVTVIPPQLLPQPVPPAPVAEPVPAPKLEAAPESQFAPPAFGEADFEKTVVARRSKPKWTLQVEGGETITLAKSAALLGRNPTSSAQLVDAQLISIVDPSKTVSKTHARLSLSGETWSIVDLESTNGVFLVSDSDEEIELEPGVSTDVEGAFRLGDLILRISRGK